MKTPSARDLALQTLNKLDLDLLPCDPYLDEIFQRSPLLSRRDRAFALHLVKGVLRWRLRLDWMIRQQLHFDFKKLEPAVLNILRLALFQVLYMDRVPDSAAVNQAVNQTKSLGKPHLVSMVNGVLRQLCRERNRISFPGPENGLVESLSIFYSYPKWLVSKWIRELGTETTEKLLRAQNQIPRLVIRVNTLKTDRKELLQRLQIKGLKAEPTRYSPDGIRIQNLKGPVTELSGFQEGLFQVQGEAAQLCARILFPRPGEEILDLCAGIGGKATHAAELMENKGLILALDINPRKLSGLMQSARRLGIHCVYGLVADATGPLCRLFPKGFNKVMVDGPCSALGILAKHPDGKWIRKESDVHRLSRLQRKILDRATSLLKRGGEMLYVTCTISREENEESVGDLLKRHPELAVGDLKIRVPPEARELVDDNGFLRTFPHLHETDGFFGALISKT